MFLCERYHWHKKVKKVKKHTGKMDVSMMVGVLLALSQGSLFGQHDIINAQNSAIQEALTGIWTAEIGGSRIRFSIDDSSNFELGAARGEYRVENAALLLIDGTGKEARYQVAFTGSSILMLSGGDLSQPLKFVRMPESASKFIRFFRLNFEDVQKKAINVGIILLVTIASRLLLGMLEVASVFVIFSDRSLFKYLYRENKNRRKTIHSFSLNIAKYVVYFVALGLILSQIGVNYTAYIASLSVIGLAVAFGSQGLVQDIVTGFFVIFENQFDVGDMVEISGHVGLVREMGLRMTKIQNYQGLIVYIPNRNIAIAGKYAKGVLEGYIDVALSSGEDFANAKKSVTILAAELGRQFDEVFLKKTRAEPVLSLKTGEFFLRLHISIWPGQTWVIDQQFVPRIRESLTASGITIPFDRIVSYYHLQQTQQAASLSDRIRLFRRNISRRRKA